MKKPQDEGYTRDYNRGWRYSQSPSATLDHADAIGASDAWLDGYSDLAAAREKWHTYYCRLVGGTDCPEHQGSW